MFLNNLIHDINEIKDDIIDIKKFIKKHPNKSWNWKWIIENTNIKLEKYIPLNLISNKYIRDYYKLSENPNITEEFILKYPYQNWNIKYLIDNNKITDFNSLSKFKHQNNIIYNYQNKPWDWEWLIENTSIDIGKCIPINLFKKNTRNYYSLSKNPNLTEEFILKYPYKNWDIKYLIKNNKIIDFKALSKFKYIDKYIINNYPNKPWDWKWLLENTDINIPIGKYQNIYNQWTPDPTKEFILKHPNKNWDIEYLIESNKITNFNTLTKFKNITEYIIEEYSDKQWDWEWLTENTEIIIEKYISLDLIEKYKNILYYYTLSKNPNITEEFILKYPYKNWDIEYLIENNKITDFNSLSKFININNNIIDIYPNKPWDWKWLLENTNISIEKHISLDLIEKYPYKLCYINLSKNPNITKKFILKYPYQKWDIDYLLKHNKITESEFLNIQNQKIIN